MNTRHLEFFKNSYYKWLNKRPLGITHIYLFISYFNLLSLNPDIRPFKVIYFVSFVTVITFWFMGSYLMTLYFL